MNRTVTPAWSTDAERWEALTQRDPHADGAFFYGVKTTGVFCRPSCASRQPRRENVDFFATTDAARAAGYRDCKRCQPGGLPRELEIVNRACAALDADPQERLTLAQLSDAVHVSPFHLQRLFKRVVGVSPRQYQAAQRGAALREALHRGTDVTRATVDAGFGSPSRMYETAPTELGMAPSAYRRKGAGLTVHYASAPTSLGFVLVAATAKGICKIGFGDDASALATELRGEFANAQLVEDAARLAPFIAQVDAYLHGTRQRFDLPLDIDAPAFRQRVAFPTARREAIRTSPKPSVRRVRCAPSRAPARRTRSRWRFRVIASYTRAGRSPAIAGDCRARPRYSMPKPTIRA
jgi:AraC family transcriptional regulator of adaptative response/methylated-DNA-[protein]-cysteine methyltransferase